MSEKCNKVLGRVGGNILVWVPTVESKGTTPRLTCPSQSLGGSPCDHGGKLPPMVGLFGAVLDAAYSRTLCLLCAPFIPFRPPRLCAESMRARPENLPRQGDDLRPNSPPRHLHHLHTTIPPGPMLPHRSLEAPHAPTSLRNPLIHFLIRACPGTAQAGTVGNFQGSASCVAKLVAHAEHWRLYGFES